MSLAIPKIVPAPLASVNDAAAALVAVVCAGSAGVHAALVPEHLHESLLLGCAFALDALLLALVAGVLGDPRVAGRAALPAAGVLALTATAYVLSRTTGLPVLIPEAEPVDGLGMLTTLGELVAVGACLLLTLRRERR
jgi:hypothetical protein